MGPQILVNDGKDNAVLGHYDDNLNLVIDDPKPVMHYWVNIKRTPVVAELVALASERTNAGVEYRDTVGQFSDMDLCDAAEAYDNGYNPDRLQLTMGSLWCDNYRGKGEFWNELYRLEALVTKPLDEPILHDDYPLHQGLFYVVNGKVRQFIDGVNMTVKRWKALRIPNVEDVTEVRRCDMVGRQLRLPEKETQVRSTTPMAGTLIRNGQGLREVQKHRRRRSSNKIKKTR